MLYPLAKSSIELGKKILRKDMFNTITKHDHRLCVFITDGCQSDNIQCEVAMSATNSDPIYMFSAFLLYGKGKYNIQSASPEKNEIPLGTTNCGTFFTNSFVNNMEFPIEDTGQFDINERIHKWVQSDLSAFYKQSGNRQTIKIWEDALQE